jgi:hypothetical protein
MLKDDRGKNSSTIRISEKTRMEMVDNINTGILKKLEAARKFIEIDLEISAGLYTYVVEELGKLLLLTRIKIKSGKCTVKYSKEFVSHNKKFETAFNYIQENNIGECLVVSDEGSFTAKSFTWRSYSLGLIPDTKQDYLYFILTLHTQGKVEKTKTLLFKKYPYRSIGLKKP